MQAQPTATATIRTSSIKTSSPKSDMPAAHDADLQLGVAAQFWHDTGLQVTLRDYTRADMEPTTKPPTEQPGPCYTTRALAIVHLAMYDAYAIATGNATPYGEYSDMAKESCARLRLL